jgi:hypothetical protein
MPKDYIITDRSGEWACKPEEFEETFESLGQEPAEPSSPVLESET